MLRSKIVVIIIIIPNATRNQQEVHKGKGMIDLYLWHSLLAAGREWRELQYEATGAFYGKMMWLGVGDGIGDGK